MAAVCRSGVLGLAAWKDLEYLCMIQISPLTRVSRILQYQPSPLARVHEQSAYGNRSCSGPASHFGQWPSRSLCLYCMLFGAQGLMKPQVGGAGWILDSLSSETETGHFYSQSSLERPFTFLNGF